VGHKSRKLRIAEAAAGVDEDRIDVGEFWKEDLVDEAVQKLARKQAPGAAEEQAEGEAEEGGGESGEDGGEGFEAGEDGAYVVENPPGHQTRVAVTLPGRSVTQRGRPKAHEGLETIRPWMRESEKTRRDRRQAKKARTESM
jgi:hypothetical protein